MTGAIRIVHCAVCAMTLLSAWAPALAQGLEPVGSTPEQFADYIRNELAMHSKLIRDAGLKFQ